MISAQNGRSSTRQSRSVLVVKRTFLEFECSPDSQDGLKPKSGLRNVCSDSALYDMAGGSEIDCFTPLQSATLDSEHPEEELVLMGLSDEETESVVTSTTDEPHSGSSSFASQDTARSSSKEQPTPALEMLAAENARLAMENLELRQQCLHISNITSSAKKNEVPTGMAPIHCDTPEMLASDPFQSLDSLPTFAMPDAMQPEPMPQMGALPLGASGGAFGFFPTNYVWMPIECSMPVASTPSNTDMYAHPTGFLDAVSQHAGASRTGGRRGARAARAEQMFSKHAAIATSDREAASKYVPRTPKVPSDDEPIQEPTYGDELVESSETCSCPPHLRTTVMLRNLPNNYTRAMLLDLIDGEGYGSLYDFMYLPIDFNSKASLGYAFINFASHSVAQQFTARFHGFTNWDLPSRKVCIVNWSGPHQGFEAHIQRYRNSPVMHEAVPDVYKPVVFVDGKRATFPPPAKKLRAPRIRYFRNGNRGDFQGRTLGNSTQFDDALVQPRAANCV